MKKPVQGRTYASVIFVVGILFLFSDNDRQAEQVKPRVITATQSYSFTQNIRPILDTKCLACHSCYDAPCQLKLESFQGLERGASKARVYDGGRLKDSPPTRLYIDAQTPEEWLKKGFYSVLSEYSDKADNTTPPLMQQMLDLGQNNPLTTNTRVPDTIELGFDRVNYCPAPGEFNDYVDKFPHGGMPLAVSGLDKQEYQTLSTWLKQGAKIDTPPVAISDTDQLMISRWEDWLNRRDKRSILLSRYLYEHLFLGHLYLNSADQSDGQNHPTTRFYQLIRSYTPAGEKPVIVPTVRPNDRPDNTPQQRFYYRLIPLPGTVVHKTHITYRFDSQRLEQYQKLFYSTDWQVDSLPGYGYEERSNPFITFAAIPAKLRYRFLLNDARFFVRNFIRGPVCRGQIATNVIRDQFWVMFESPDTELYSNNPEYQLSVNDYLGLPGEKSSLLDFGSQWFTYSDKRNSYLDMRQKAYQQAYPSGAVLQQIWDGDQTNDNAFLTVFRHHNSASVTSGWQGEIPLTAWVMGYPLLERTYYELVVNFDVFGSVSHQAQTRLYFDLIRNGSETNFLRFMPAASRQTIYSDWYQSSARIKAKITYHDLDTRTPSNIAFSSDKPKEELLRTLLERYPQLTGTDNINRCNDCKQRIPGSANENDTLALSNIAAKPAADLTAIKWLPEVTFVRINLDKTTTDSDSATADKQFKVFTLLRNRRHSSVAFLLGESLRYQEDLDTLTILSEPVGSYPNLILQLKQSQLDDFVSSFEAIDSDSAFDQFVERWGVGRMNPQFWQVFHSFTAYMEAIHPLEAGVYDMNRYGHW
ncbi:Fatty acid cis/trans isomerase (CTI) [Amphritea atlantica]|uniref:Fatty acid cis/trans isomerase (CTI) n=1 Tax=Amphritea atlantica TaxID=355243 RepID=A0A1H9IIK0_9GAMM|nr:fatty acid cis/trans isomerase [Amphritea atlantica]SEQ74379.1 Fatty acid cis/trans isomerase (CTI) [Amphritea atlantica]